MRKTLYLLAFLLAFLTFSSCEDSDEEVALTPQQTIVGQYTALWNLVLPTTLNQEVNGGRVVIKKVLPLGTVNIIPEKDEDFKVVFPKIDAQLICNSLRPYDNAFVFDIAGQVFVTGCSCMGYDAFSHDQDVSFQGYFTHSTDVITCYYGFELPKFMKAFGSFVTFSDDEKLSILKELGIEGVPPAVFDAQILTSHPQILVQCVMKKNR